VFDTPIGLGIVLACPHLPDKLSDSARNEVTLGKIARPIVPVRAQSTGDNTIQVKPPDMPVRRNCVRKLVPVLLAVAALPVLFAQNDRRLLSGHMRLGIVAANDRGRVDASLVLRHVTITLEPTAAQQADLTNLLASQQDPASPDFHEWLTPDQFGARFGLSEGAMSQVTSWLANQNLKVDSIGRSHYDCFYGRCARCGARPWYGNTQLQSERREPFRERERALGACLAGRARPGGSRTR
jgi:hypothetical protein